MSANVDFTTYWQRPSFFVSGGCIMVTSVISLVVGFLESRHTMTYSDMGDMTEIGTTLYTVGAMGLAIGLLEMYVFMNENIKVRVINFVFAAGFLVYTMQNVLNIFSDTDFTQIAERIMNEGHYKFTVCFTISEEERN